VSEVVDAIACADCSIATRVVVISEYASNESTVDATSVTV